MEEHAGTAQVEPASPVAESESAWSDLGAVAIGLTVVAFIIPYVWLAIRRFEKMHRP